MPVLPKPATKKNIDTQRWLHMFIPFDDYRGQRKQHAKILSKINFCTGLSNFFKINDQKLAIKKAARLDSFFWINDF